MIGSIETLKESLLLDILEWMYVKGSMVHGTDKEIERKIKELRELIEDDMRKVKK